MLALRKASQKSKVESRNSEIRNSKLETRQSLVTSHSSLATDPAAALRIALVGANPAPQLAGLEELPGKSNYFIGNDPKKWRTGVPAYAKVQYKQVYPGVDLVYYGNQRELEYDFVVRPGADPKVIRLAVVGGGTVRPQLGAVREPPLRIDADGDLVIETDGGELRFRKPLVYQVETDNRKSEIQNRKLLDGRYVLRASNRKSKIQDQTYEVSFEVAAYDPRKPLIIDPVLSYSSYLGGTATDSGTSIAVDSSGNAYITGSTFSTDFPFTAGVVQPAIGGGTCLSGSASRPCFDVFVTKLNPTGSALVYSTYFGGTGEDFGSGIAVDGAFNAYVTGTTSSTNFPTTLGAFQTALKGLGSSDAFVTKLSPNGSALVYSTYLGGSGTDTSSGIAVDSSGSAYVTGSTSSNDFPVTLGSFQVIPGGGATDAFVVKMKPDGSDRVYASFLGGKGTETGFGIAVDALGNAYVTGETASTDFPTTGGVVQAAFGGGTTDAFVTKVSPDGSTKVYSTFLGGSDNDRGTAITVDSSGSAYLTGFTNSINFPTASPLQAKAGTPPDAFVTKLNATASALVYSTFLGGSGGDLGNGIAVDSSGNAYVAGQTGSPDFPVASPIETAISGGLDAFVTEINAAGSALLFSSYLGGSGPDGGNGIALDASGNIYVTGTTSSTDFPTIVGSFQTSNAGALRVPPGGLSRAFVSKISSTNAPVVSLSKTQITFTSQSIGTTSIAQTSLLRNVGSASLNITTGITSSGDFAESDTCGSVVAGGANCALTITFSPTAAGNRAGTVTITDNATGSPHLISLTGTGISTAVTLSTSSLTFPSQPLGTTSAPMSVTLNNTGSDALTILGIVASGNFAQSTVPPNACGGTVAGGGNCTINVTFTPKVSGTQTGLLTITDNAPGSPHTVQLSGTGLGPGVSLSSSNLVFSAQPVDTTSAPQTLTLTNTGNVSLVINSVTPTGDFAQKNNCGASVAAAANCTITVTFSPKAAGTEFGAITISDNAPGSPHIVLLTGTSVAGPAPAVGLSTTSLSFPIQAATTTSGPQTVTLTNTGNGPLTFTSIVALGNFAQTNTCGTSIAGGANCTISVTFTPTAVGPTGGTLTITDNAPGSPRTVALKGLGTDFGMSASPSLVVVPAGQTAKYAVTLTPFGGFNQSLSLTCTDALQTTQCFILPFSATLDGTNPTTVNVSVTTTARSAAPPHSKGPGIFFPPAFGLHGMPLVLGILVLAMLGARMTARLGWRRVWLAWGAMLLVLLWGACNVGRTGPARPPGTPAGTFKVTVNAQLSSTTLSHSIDLGLTVQ